VLLFDFPLFDFSWRFFRFQARRAVSASLRARRASRFASLNRLRARLS
jgi:hypothetical protein